jgi:hypothetical protein
MDLGFIGKPHEWDPRRLYSQTGADWQYRVDFVIAFGRNDSRSYVLR